jgi:hypothetical protein
VLNLLDRPAVMFFEPGGKLRELAAIGPQRMFRCPSLRGEHAQIAINECLGL